MKRFWFLACVLFLFLLVAQGAMAANTDETATTPGKTGGYIYFETAPSDATILLDGVKIGTSPFTYYSEKTGTLDVVVKKRLYEDYSGYVTVNEGTRVTFLARLTPLPSELPPAQSSPPIVMTTAAVVEKSSPITVPTPWPSPTQESPAGPLAALGAVALCTAFVVIRRR